MELTSDAKREVLNQRILSIDLRISVLQNKIAAGEENKEGLLSFEDMLVQEISKKTALINIRESL
jgi:hypothetical protein